MMVDQEVITSRLAKIRESVSMLKPILEAPRDEYVGEPDNYLRGERLFEMAAQAMIDIASHIVAGLGAAKAENFGELADILVKEGVVRPALNPALHGIFAMRNILVHEYLTVDRGRFYDEARAGLEDIEAFCQDVAAWMRRETGDAS